MRRTYTMLFTAAALCVFAHGAWAWDLPLDIDLIKVHFNHNTGSTASDGINMSADFGTVIVAPEWDSTIGKNKACGYTLAVDDPVVKAEFFCSDMQDFSSVKIYTYKTGGDGSWALDTTTVTFNPSGFSGQVSMNTKANGKQPNTVGKNSFAWSWRVLYVDQDELAPPYEIGRPIRTTKY